MASWNIPALINKISEDVPAIKALLTALFKWTDADTTDVPVGAKRLQDVAGGRQVQEYSGSAWGNVGKLMHDVDMLDGKHASTAQTADTIPVRDANGTIPGNISGNAATATEASSLASGYTTPVVNGGTGATTEAGARASLGADNASNINSGILDIAYGGTGSSTKNFVDLTENQNVGGIKTFSSEIKSTAGTFVSGVMTGISNADTSRGQSTKKLILCLSDKDNKRFFGIETEAATDGSRRIYCHLQKRADDKWVDGFQFKELADGTVQTLALTPPAAANDTQIASTAWVTTFCETTKKYLYKTGDVMTGILDIKKDNQGVRHWSGVIVKGTNPTATRYVYEEFLDKNGARLGWAGVAQGKDGSINLRLECVKQDATTATSIGVGWTKEKVATSWAPTPATASNSTEIATTAFVKAQGYITSSGSISGNAATATKATKDSANQQINTTYIKALSVSGKTITYTKGDGTTGTITTQDTNTTYGNMKGATASAAGAAGLVPAPAKGKQGQYLRGDGAWATPTNTTYANFVKSGSSAAAGLVPKPSTTAGTSKYLREDCSWQVPPNTNTTYGVFGINYNGLVPGMTDYYKQSDFILSVNGWRCDYQSDRRVKQDFENIPEELIDIWGEVRWHQFLFKDEAKARGENAKIHAGLVVQDLHELYEKHGIDIKKYAFTLHDLREAVPAIYDDGGNLVCSEQEAVDVWVLKYHEVLAFEALYLRKKIRLLEERLARVESKVN